jgi:hypothetical protein
MTDDSYDNGRIDERVRKLATEHYNPRRGTVPREAMWASVAAARRAERAEREGAAIIPIHAGRRAVHWRWAAALAAGLVFGVVIDRAVVGGDRASGPSIATIAPTPMLPPVVVGPKQRVAGGPDAITDSTARKTRSRRMPGNASSAPQRVAKATTPAAARTIPRDVRPSPDPRGLYQVAAMQTLVQAEALLTTYRRADDGQRDAESMGQAARWSRDVLSSTRLLLDSPAARDPRLRQLLTDLELVLAQIVQLSGAPLQAGERELIERALRDRDLLPRLRSAVPAGATS